MPTPSEQKALVFLSLVILLGGAVRVVRAGAFGGPEQAGPADRQALARQATAVDSAASAERAGRAHKSPRMSQKARKRLYGGAKFDSTGVMIDTSLTPSGFPPPGPRIDVGPTAGLPGRAPGGGAPLVDVDVAGQGELERLPGVGPALAGRIVASRDALGPFGSLAALGRVKGMGPATLRRLAPLVTFSAPARR